MNPKTLCLSKIALHIVAVRALRVCITGVDAAGKTRFSSDLARELQLCGQKVLLAHGDDFHNPRNVRYGRGSSSAEGFYRDTTDIAGLRSALLTPLLDGGDRCVRTRIFDYRRDCFIDEPPVRVEAGTILILEGIFLIRPELAGCFDLTVFLEVPFAKTFHRMALRDGSDPDPFARTSERYRCGQEMWLAEMKPRDVADFVVENSDFDAPKLVAMRGQHC